jgi:DMSO/TMAO reductase YedYZ molybdopterin-dependent catalytic subunit
MPGGRALAPLLQEAGVLEQGSEVIFWGADQGTVTIRDNSGVVSGGQTGAVEPDAGGALDLTITEQFARSMSLDEALNRDNLLCYEMNGKPLPPANGFPVRLIAPGWYGVANVKWLTRIEVVDHRYAGRFMARDYVTIREEQRGETVWTFTTVSHDRLKSAPAKVTRRATDTRSGAPPGAHRSRRWRFKSTMDPGWRRGSMSLRHAGKSHVATPGGSGGSTGGRPPRASTKSRRGRSTSMATCSRRRTTPSSPAREPTGRATVT